MTYTLPVTESGGEKFASATDHSAAIVAYVEERVQARLNSAVTPEAAADILIAAQQSATEAALYDGPKVDTFSQLATVTPAMLGVGGLIRVIATGAVYQRVASGGDLDYSGAGGVRLNVLPETLAAPYLEQTTKALQLIPWAMQSEIVQGAGNTDHTALVASILAGSGRRALEFPKYGVFNTDKVHLIHTHQSREIDFGQCEFRRRADYVAGDWAATLRNIVPTDLSGVGQYGYWKGLRLIGGVFDQGDFDNNRPIAFLTYLQDAKIEGLTVKHRPANRRHVTLDSATDVFTISSGANPWQNGARLAMEAVVANGVPAGYPGAGVPMYVINRTSSTFQLSLTRGGASINWTSNGAGVFVCAYGNWALGVGGRDLILTNCRTLTDETGGADLYQDGLHIMHGDGICVNGGNFEAGDDAIAFGAEEDAFISEGIQNVTVSGARVISSTAYAVGAYIPFNPANRWVRGVEVSGLVGSAGTLRNGLIKIRDYDDSSPLANPLMSGISITDFDLTLGSAGRTDPTSAYIARVWGASNVKIEGTARVVGTGVAFGEFDVQRSRDTEINLAVFGSYTRQTNGRVNAERLNFSMRPERNLIPNATELTGVVNGVRDGIEGTQPTGWSKEAMEAGWGWKKSVFTAGSRNGAKIFGTQLYGTSGAGGYVFTLAIGPDARSGYAETKIPCVTGQRLRLSALVGLTGAIPAGVTFEIWIRERTAAGAYVGGALKVIPPFPHELSDQDVSYTCAGDNFVQAAILVTLTSGAKVADFGVLVCDPQLV